MLSSITYIDCYNCNCRRASQRTPSPEFRFLLGHSLTLPSLSMLAYILTSASRSVRLHNSLGATQTMLSTEPEATSVPTKAQ